MTSSVLAGGNAKSTVLMSAIGSVNQNLAELVTAGPNSLVPPPATKSAKTATTTQQSLHS